MKNKFICIEPNCNNKISEWNFKYGQCRCRSCSKKGSRTGSYIDGRKTAKHYCIEPNCNNEIKYCNWLCGSKRCRQCADKNMGKLKIGTKRPDLSEINKKRLGKLHPRFKGKEAIQRQKYYCKDCNKEIYFTTALYGDGRCSSCANKLKWQNEEYRDKVIKNTLKGLKLKPNKPEKLLNKLLNNLFPKEYKFVGDGKVILGGFNPDFINCNGQKKIIEMFGDYWHNRKEVIKRDKRRLIAYKKYGYKTLIIWEHELKNIEMVIAKLLEFEL